MKPIEHFHDLKIKNVESESNIETYSLTSDVLSYRRCARQYHLIRELKFPPPNATQMYFGTIIHQTLDRVHSHYKESERLNGIGDVPSDMELMSYFRDVENGLFARSISPFSKGRRGKLTIDDDEELCSLPYEELSNIIGAERASAFIRLRLFNNIYGKNLYPKVIDTECRIDISKKDYIITGIVDVLKQDDANGVEIWDYKSYESSVFDKCRNGMISQLASDIIMQMRLYCQMYKLRSGINPTKGVIVCIGDLDPKLSEKDQLSELRSGSILYSDFTILDELSYHEALTEFDGTIQCIRESRRSKRWESPKEIDAKTCNACPIRWSCKSISYPHRYP